MRSVLALAVSFAVLASCAEQVDTGAAIDVAPSAGILAQDCEATPLAAPTIDVQGAEVPESGRLRLAGVIDGIARRDGWLELALREEVLGPVSIRLWFAQPVPIDLRIDSNVEIGYWRRAGFEGTAHGIRIDDEVGAVLIADDGEYGNAVPREELAPFTIVQADAGCRNRENRPGDLNNFRLVVSDGDASVELIHGETAGMKTSSREYAILALRSVARVGDVVWTDAPYQFMSFVVFRRPNG